MAGLFALAGCGHPAPSQAPATQPVPAVPATQPTTAPAYQTLDLIYVPVTVRVPANWEVKPEDNGQCLEGPLPNPVSIPDGMILLSHRGLLSKDDLKFFLMGEQATAAREPERILLIGPRALDKATVLEIRMAPRDQTLASASQPTTMPGANPHLFHWTIWVIVPAAGNSYRRFSMDFDDLDVDTYRANRAFLESIVASIAFDPKSILDLSR